MNTHMQTDAWIPRIVIVPGLILVSSVAGTLIRKTAGQPIPEIFIARGAVAAGGLVRLSISPLNQ
jgi:hypothetical protein